MTHRNPTPTPSEGALHLLEEVKALVREHVQMFGFIDPVAHLLALRDPNTGERLSEPALLIVPLTEHLGSGEQAKDLWVSSVRAIARRVEAVSVVVATYARCRFVSMPPTPAFEAVVICLEHANRAHSIIFSRVTRDGASTVLGAFEELDVRAAEGRLIGFLPMPRILS